jgi:hypothetical protein
MAIGYVIFTVIAAGALGEAVPQNYGGADGAATA